MSKKTRQKSMFALKELKALRENDEHFKPRVLNFLL